MVRRTGQDVAWDDARDVWWHEVVDRQPDEHEAEAFDAEHPLYIMYTSGTTAKPKGILHTSGGYLTHVSATHRLIFDLKPEKDVFWTAADIGWVTGHSYIVYGPLANAATSVMYEGTPDTPDPRPLVADRRALQGHHPLHRADHHPHLHEVGRGPPGQARPVQPPAPRFGGRADQPRGVDLVPHPHRRRALPHRRHLVADRDRAASSSRPLPGITATKPGAAMTPFPGIAADVIDNDGRSVGNGEGGYLVITEPWPGMLRGIYGDDERYKETYWSRFPGRYFAGDGAKRDEDGDLWLLGRVDDVMNISGHRISTTEVEHALVGHPAVAEAAVVGANDATTGQAIVAFVTVKGASDAEGEAGEQLVRELRDHVAREIGPIAKPRQIMLTPELPKTRSGKIMRRLLRDVADDRPLGDVTTLLDPTVVNAIKDHMGEGGDDKE